MAREEEWPKDQKEWQQRSGINQQGRYSCRGQRQQLRRKVTIQNLHVGFKVCCGFQDIEDEAITTVEE